MKHLQLSLIPAILIGFVTFRSAQGVHQHLQAEQAKLQQQLEEDRATQALREQLAKSLGEIERLREAYLAPEANTEWLVREVAKLAEEQGLRLTSMMPQNPKALQDATQLSVTVQSNATYHQLGKFLSAVERTRPLMWVEDLNVSPQSEMAWAGAASGWAKADSSSAQIRLTVSTLSMASQNPKRPREAARTESPGGPVGSAVRAGDGV